MFKKSILIQYSDGSKKREEYSEFYPNSTILDEFIKNKHQRTMLVSFVSKRWQEKKFYFAKIGGGLFSKSFAKYFWNEFYIPDISFKHQDNVNLLDLGRAQAKLLIHKEFDIKEEFSRYSERKQKTLRKLSVFTDKQEFRNAIKCYGKWKKKM